MDPTIVRDPKNDTQKAPRPRQARAVLSCVPCRHSKLKCNREQPCGQCIRKARSKQCVYATRVDRDRPATRVAAQLKRLEDMVRGMIGGEGSVVTSAPRQQQQQQGLSPAEKDIVLVNNKDDNNENENVTRGGGSVLKGDETSTYIGPTHFMAMLEDIEDLRQYFEYPEDEDDLDKGVSASAGVDDIDLILHIGCPSSMDKEQLLSHLPEKTLLSQIVMRYFSSMSPSQSAFHRPTFRKTYSQFCQDPRSMSYHWLAQLFMILSLSIFFSNRSSSHTAEDDPALPSLAQAQHYRRCAAWAIARGKITQPTFQTIPALLLFAEAELVMHRTAQLGTYIMTGVLNRILLKMGYHRKPSKLPKISPMEGEVRRRVWNLAVMLDTIGSFHMGLPSMLAGIDADVETPRNYCDEDLEENCTELPPERPHSEWTPSTYPIYKGRMLKVFDQIARLNHALATPEYAEVIRMDNLLRETWDAVPDYLHVRPLDECVGESPFLLIQRFGITALYHKSRCVLHRRYLVEIPLQREYDFSRHQCLDGAVTLLQFQHTAWEASKPGHVLAQNGWYISSLAVHDYLLAAVAVYLAIRNGYYRDADRAQAHGWQGPQPLPTKEELKALLERSHDIWVIMANATPDLAKTATTLKIMLARLESPGEDGQETGTSPGWTPNADGSSVGSTLESSLASATGFAPFDQGLVLPFAPDMGIEKPTLTTEGPPLDIMGGMPLPSLAMGDNGPLPWPPNTSAWDAAAGGDLSTMDWTYVDASLGEAGTAVRSDEGAMQDPNFAWLEDGGVYPGMTDVNGFFFPGLSSEGGVGHRGTEG